MSSLVVVVATCCCSFYNSSHRHCHRFNFWRRSKEIWRWIGRKGGIVAEGDTALLAEVWRRKKGRSSAVVWEKREGDTAREEGKENINEKLGLFTPFVPLDQPNLTKVMFTWFQHYPNIKIKEEKNTDENT